MYFILRTVLINFLWAVVLGNILRSSNQKQKIPKGVWNLDETFFKPTGLLDSLYKDLLADRSQDKYMNFEADTHEGIQMKVNSTCPWTYRIAWNWNRLPSHHVEAVCLSYMCLKSNSMETAHTDLDDESEAVCSKIEYVRWVKVREDKSKSFKKKLLKFNVGCTCKATPMANF